jgi:hypothetical protein
VFSVYGSVSGEECSVKNRIGRLLPLIVLVLFCACASTAALAGASGDRTQFGHDINVAPGEQISEVTCFGCSVRVRGQVNGDVTTFGGSIVVEDEGQIGGDATTFGGGVRLDGKAAVKGDLTVFGGRVRRDPSASVGGDVTNFGSVISVLMIVVMPLLFVGGIVALIIWIVRRATRPSLPAAA